MKMKTYKLEDIFKFAINMENQGRNFYDTVILYANDDETKKLFAYLRDQEEKHAKTFSKLYNIYSKNKLSFSADENFEEVLDTLLRGLLLPDISEVRDYLSKNKKKGMVSVIKIGMDVELNTILFYQKLNEKISDRQSRKALDDIIKEEETHLSRFKNLRMDLDPLYAGIEYGKFF